MSSKLVRLTSPEVSKRLILAWVTPDFFASERRDKLSARRRAFALAAIFLLRSPGDSIFMVNILSLNDHITLKLTSGRVPCQFYLYTHVNWNVVNLTVPYAVCCRSNLSAVLFRPGPLAG